MTSIDIRFITDDSTEDGQTTFQIQELEDDLLQRVSTEQICLLRKRKSLYNRKITDITGRDSQIPSEEMTERVLNAFFDSIEDAEPRSKVFGDEYLRELLPEASTSEKTQKRETIKTYLESQLEQHGAIEVKARKIGIETGLSSNAVGRILGDWSRSEDAPFSISATEKDGTGNLWHVTD